MASTFEEILSSPVLRNTISNTFDAKPFSVIERPGSFILSLNKEPDDKIVRILVLKPNGFTANSLDELSSHPEARDATIVVKGFARKGNLGYVVVKDCVKFIYYPNKDAETLALFPYAKAENALSLVKGSRMSFKVVKPSGYGFYHNLVNLTSEWLVLILKKKLDHTKNIDFKLLDRLNQNESKLLRDFLTTVEEDGDSIFEKNKTLVSKVVSLSSEKSLPALVSFLNVPEAGKHEQCTVFAVILKIAKRYPALAREAVLEATKNKVAQSYYLEQLIRKIGK